VTLAENRGMLALALSLGFTARREFSDATLMRPRAASSNARRRCARLLPSAPTQRSWSSAKTSCSRSRSPSC
jgi:hypothetical protein